jgi:hypothetical protein
MHTINAVDRIIVVDGQRGYFQPMQQVLRAVKRRFAKNADELPA